VSRFETEVLTAKENQAALAQVSGKWIDRVMKARKLTRIVPDMDSSVSRTLRTAVRAGRQEGLAYNGHFDCSCYYPLLCFNQFGDLEEALLREGNAHSAKDWKAVFEPVVARYRDLAMPKLFRGDAAFAYPDIYEYLVNWTQLSCHYFAVNTMRLQLFAPAYDFGNFLGQLVLPKQILHWSMTTLREKFIKIGAKVVRHPRYTILKPAEVAVSRELFSDIIARTGQTGEMFSNTA
jgi:hypothetical protein